MKEHIMEKLKIEYKFDLEDFIVMENIEHSYFPNDNITTAEEVMKWYEKNNLTCIGVRNADNQKWRYRNCTNNRYSSHC